MRGVNGPGTTEGVVFDLNAGSEHEIRVIAACEEALRALVSSGFADDHPIGPIPALHARDEDDRGLASDLGRWAIEADRSKTEIAFRRPSATKDSPTGQAILRLTLEHPERHPFLNPANAGDVACILRFAMTAIQAPAIAPEVHGDVDLIAAVMDALISHPGTADPENRRWDMFTSPSPPWPAAYHRGFSDSKCVMFGPAMGAEAMDALESVTPRIVGGEFHEPNGPEGRIDVLLYPAILMIAESDAVDTLRAIASLPPALIAGLNAADRAYRTTETPMDEW